MTIKRTLLEGTQPTEGELDALFAVARPMASYQSAAEGLGLTVQGLESRLRRLYARLGVSSSVQALWVLVSLGVLDARKIGYFHAQDTRYTRRSLTEVAPAV